ncbi:DUF5058 family protein [Merdimmobilis hominis]|jgi:hypothetical protein|uniref:DUF5058 domain-containing protein n=2 Tax=Oscillospiraceae TaxID=216572 RepID=A0A6N2VC69_9FIRM|nr:DUF5058 family protein [Merdimmobilis hominis]MCD4837133.1 DUF5058 family protein [Merdimmobilis hominis]PWL61263.1 MAG: DUF5058 domain-containing protein [Oscillospiraceae bacterium]
MDYLEIANSPVMWAACTPAIVLVLVQAAMFTKKAMKDGKRMGITDEQFKTAISASFTASIGPSIVILIGMVSLLASVGGPLSWMRLAYIGSVTFELGAADKAATAAGAQLGTSSMTAEVFACCAWVMCICCLGWIIVSALFTDKMDVLRAKASGGSPEKLAIISAGGTMGAFSYMTFDRAFPLNVQTYAAVIGFVVMFVLISYGKKSGAKWPAKWGMTIAMFAGMLGGAFFL